jgi:hypothetical protein
VPIAEHWFRYRHFFMVRRSEPVSTKLVLARCAAAIFFFTEALVLRFLVAQHAV